MPTTPITDFITWMEMVFQIGITTVELSVLNYLVFQGGWLDMIRLIAFWLDKTLIKYIDQFYSYFEKILAGEIFSPTVVDNVMKNVYVFVSLLVLLKLLLLFMKYLASPEMVSDDRIGAQALVKRVILGMCGMLALPMIFDFSIDLQKAILNDNLFGKLLLDRNQLREYEKNKDQMGRMLAFNVYQAFWNLDKSSVTSSAIQKKYDNALKLYDPGVIGDINEKFGEDYAYDYFPIASTVVLIYVIYLVIKYCIDVVVRMFKLFLLQMLGPLALSDYMVNGDSKEVFKNWVKTTLSVYAMLFVRIFSIWFIAFIMILMQGDCTHFEKDPTTGEPTEVCADESLLYIKPGEEPDYLLKGIITLGLLALLMDLPKFLSDILGLDLEQDATVKGLMQKVGGAAKGVALGGLAIGGAAVGGAIGAGKSVLGQTKFGKNMQESRNKMAEKHGVLASLGKQGTTFGKGLMTAALTSNSITGSAVKGYQGQKQEQQNASDKTSSELAKSSAEARERARDENLAKIVQSQGEQTKNQEFATTMSVAARMADSGLEVTPQTVACRLKPEAFDHTSSMVANISGVISGIASSSVSETDISNGKVTGESRTRAVQEVEQVLITQCAQSGISVPKEQIKIQAEYIVDNTTFNPPVTPGDTITATVDVNMVTTATGNLASQDQTITQVVNQVQGTKVGAEQLAATQIVNQQLGQIVNNTEEMNVYAEITTEHVEKIRQDVSQQVSIQRDIKQNTDDIK